MNTYLLREIESKMNVHHKINMRSYLKSLRFETNQKPHFRLTYPYYQTHILIAPNKFSIPFNENLVLIRKINSYFFEKFNEKPKSEKFLMKF